MRPVTYLTLTLTLVLLSACANDVSREAQTATPLRGTQAPTPEAGTEVATALAATSPPTPSSISATATPVPASPTPMGEMLHPSPTPGEAVPATVVPPPTELPAEAGQELAIIQELYSNYWPDPFILQQGLPTTLYAVTDGLEHVNRWSIGPFAEASSMRPGQVFTFAFTPDMVGTFEIFNIGHNFSGQMLVAADCAEAERLRMEQGFQAFALIHSPADGRLFPDTITVRVGLPVLLSHLSVGGEHQVTVETLAPEPVSVGARDIVHMEFTPDQVGEFAIRHADDELAGRLLVRESACPEA